MGLLGSLANAASGGIQRYLIVGGVALAVVGGLSGWTYVELAGKRAAIAQVATIQQQLADAIAANKTDQATIASMQAQDRANVAAVTWAKGQQDKTAATLARMEAQTQAVLECAPQPPLKPGQKPPPVAADPTGRAFDAILDTIKGAQQ